MLPRPLVLLLLAALAAADHDYLERGRIARTPLGLHFGPAQRPRAVRDDLPRSADSHASTPRQSKFYRITPSGGEPVRLVYALCGQPDTKRSAHEQELVDRYLRNPPSSSSVRAQIHAARQGESLDAVEERVRSGERLYDDHRIPISPHWLTVEKDGWGAWEGELEHGGVLYVEVTESWIEYSGEEDEPVEARFDEMPGNAHFDFEIERLGHLSRRGTSKLSLKRGKN